MSSDADRYVRLIEATLQAALRERAGRSDSMSIALDYAAEAAGMPQRAAAVARLPQKYLDGAGHARPLYRGLTLYALGRVGQWSTRQAEDLARECRSSFAAFIDSGAAPKAADGSETVSIAFDALALACSGITSPAASQAAAVLEQIALRQQPDGRFLDRTASDNPEPMWYHELALLHAVTSFACRTNNTAAREASLRAAEYQAEQIQPDHASSHPFAMHAFLQMPMGVYLADMMLHAAGVQSPATMDSVSLLLLADALDCMRTKNG